MKLFEFDFKRLEFRSTFFKKFWIDSTRLSEHLAFKKLQSLNNSVNKQK